MWVVASSQNPIVCTAPNVPVELCAMSDNHPEPSGHGNTQVPELASGDLQPAVTTAAPSGRRQAFRDVRRQLTDADLASPGVQKLVLDELEQAEGECEQLYAYVERYHEADKRAAVLEEKLRPARAIEVLFAVGVGLGGAVFGLAPFFWEKPLHGVICLLIGGFLILGSVVGRVVKG